MTRGSGTPLIPLTHLPRHVRNHFLVDGCEEVERRGFPEGPVGPDFPLLPRLPGVHSEHLYPVLSYPYRKGVLVFYVTTYPFHGFPDPYGNVNY